MNRQVLAQKATYFSEIEHQEFVLEVIDVISRTYNELTESEINLLRHTATELIEKFRIGRAILQNMNTEDENHSRARQLAIDRINGEIRSVSVPILTLFRDYLQAPLTHDNEVLRIICRLEIGQIHSDVVDNYDDVQHPEREVAYKAAKAEFACAYSLADNLLPEIDELVLESTLKFATSMAMRNLNEAISIADRCIQSIATSARAEEMTEKAKSIYELIKTAKEKWIRSSRNGDA